MRIKFALVALVALSSVGQAFAAEVNVYSARNEALIKPLLDRFTAQSGIKVNLVTGKADALLQRLESEGRNTPADMLITTDAGRLHRAVEAGVFQAVNNDKLSSLVPARYRDPDGYWYGLSVRARPILYVKGKVDPKELSTYEALADAKWKGRICIRSSSNIYNQSLVASMIVASGEEKTQAWAEKFVANLARPPKGGDRDQIRAAAAGQCDIAVANTYYLGQMLLSDKEADREAGGKMGLYWPNQNDRGTHVNVSGAGITKHAKNADSATQLLAFLLNDESQKWYAEVNTEYPVRGDIDQPDVLTAWGSFKADAINLSLLGKNNASSVRLMDRAGWK